MKTKQKKKNLPPRPRVVKYPDIVSDAREMGINRTYLWLVLEGRATSAPVLARYKALKKSQKAMRRTARIGGAA